MNLVVCVIMLIIFSTCSLFYLCLPETISVWWVQSRLRAGGWKEDSSTAKHQNGVDRCPTVKNIIMKVYVTVWFKEVSPVWWTYEEEQQVFKKHFKNFKKHKNKWAGNFGCMKTHSCTVTT